MKRIEFKHPKFIKSAFSAKECPILLDAHGNPLPEIAALGRSNVGKSTLLNHLFQTKGMVKTSSTPGKTQMLNFFTLNNQLLFVDLPGYGFAKLSIAHCKRQAKVIESYLNERQPLKLLLFLIDIRRSLSDHDLQMLEWIEFRQLPTIVILTKIDKVNRSTLQKNSHALLSRLKQLPYVHYSATKNRGRRQLISHICEAL